MSKRLLVVTAVLFSGCTETLIRRSPGPSAVQSSATRAPASAETAHDSQDGALEHQSVTALQAEVQALRSEQQQLKDRFEACQSLWIARGAYFEALADYQNVGLSILAKKDDLDEVEEKTLYSALSRKGLATKQAASSVVEALGPCLNRLPPASKEYADLSALRDRLQAGQSGSPTRAKERTP